MVQIRGLEGINSNNVEKCDTMKEVLVLLSRMLEGYVEITHEIPNSYPPKRKIGNKIDIINSSMYVYASVTTLLHINPFILQNFHLEW